MDGFYFTKSRISMFTKTDDIKLGLVSFSTCLCPLLQQCTAIGVHIVNTSANTSSTYTQAPTPDDSVLSLCDELICVPELETNANSSCELVRIDTFVSKTLGVSTTESAAGTDMLLNVRTFLLVKPKTAVSVLSVRSLRLWEQGQYSVIFASVIDKR